ncbi:HAD superfamily hydrolase [Halapricum desulfuricans]|uniref:HAD superfamily hydrolase n=1 Tax=Halapricum desulfuricans TaxID=2841257 RepID=A0A897NKV3_9EURY|nr:HAD family hydrolase [Halapricum desulfuricans]QSG12065.1 HAD superfamily hydrolase [Halapricum desulfuricans]
MASAYDAWLFDLDGTLVDVDPAHPRRVFDEIGDRLGRAFSDAEVTTLWHGFGGSRNAQLRQWGIDPEPFWELFHEIEDPVRRAEATYLYDDAERLLADLEGPAGVVTHSQPPLTEAVLERLDIADRFDTVVCCGDDVGWKPDPNPVYRALDDLGVSGDGETILVGDSPSDVGAAWNAGLDAAHIERFDPVERGHCVLADHRIERLDGLFSTG